MMDIAYLEKRLKEAAERKAYSLAIKGFAALNETILAEVPEGYTGGHGPIFGDPGLVYSERYGTLFDRTVEKLTQRFYDQLATSLIKNDPGNQP